MQYYTHRGTMPLGTERLGTEGRHLFVAATRRAAIAKARRLHGKALSGFNLYSYRNFYDNDTFVIVFQQDAKHNAR